MNNDLKAQLIEARVLLSHFQFIAHGPGCKCEWCERRAAFFERTKDASAEVNR